MTQHKKRLLVGKLTMLLQLVRDVERADDERLAELSVGFVEENWPDKEE